MSKYIDVNKALSQLCLDHKDVIYIDKESAAERIRKLPSIDIVFCKACKHHSYDSCTRICDEYGLWDEVIEDDFCSKGERRE